MSKWRVEWVPFDEVIDPDDKWAPWIALSLALALIVGCVIGIALS